MAKLVIVESPAKAKTIGKYLGDDYEVTASMGHIRDLPASQLGIDVEHGYAPQYISIKGKEKLIKELKSKAKHADGVLLATDPDREGEAISWHLANILGLDPSAPNRVTFDEITKKGVKEGMAHPRAINIDLFNAQQARRELDRLGLHGDARQEGGRPVPLADDVRQWIAASMDGAGVLRASEGVIEGGNLRVTKGPLAGQEARVAKVARHRRVCEVRVGREGGRDVVERMALNVPEKS